MSTLKVAGLVAAGAGLAALIGGGAWWWLRKREQGGQRPQRVTPSRPPRAPEVPSEPDPTPAPGNTKPRGHVVTRSDLNPELATELNKLFDAGWPPDEQTIDNLEPDDVVVFAAESEETGNYTETQQELISAKVLSVETTVVRARILGPIAHAEHHGSHAGHGFRVGDLVEVQRAKILVAARRTDTDKTGFDSQGEAAATFRPSNETKEVYKVRPATPYNLDLPYRTKELAWFVDRKLVKLEHIGEHGLTEQISFSEDSLRGEVSVRALDEDPEVGSVFVARWDFALDA